MIPVRVPTHVENRMNAIYPVTIHAHLPPAPDFPVKLTCEVNLGDTQCPSYGRTSIV